MRPLLFAPLALACLAACAASTATSPPPTATAIPTTAANVESCELVCEKPQVTMTSTAPSTPDVTEAAAANVDRVFAAMHDDLLACYRNRLRASPDAHAFMTVDLVLEPDGRVRSVETTGGATLGDQGLRCITDRIRQATFDPIPGGGTRRVQVPLTFRRLGTAETI